VDWQVGSGLVRIGWESFGMAGMELKERLIKGINFFRTFSDKASTDLYKRSVLKFCDLVEEMIADKPDQIEIAKKIFNE
jgi:hypothetical protein